MGFVRNVMTVNTGVDLAMKKVRDMAADQYRDFVWEVFNRILLQTPQFSGKAVANWNLSIGSPNFTYEDSRGDQVDWLTGATRERGDQRWIKVARDRARRVMKRITYRDKVFISNGVMGDDDNGRSVEAYMESLQDPGYAARKLRLVNQPYEIVQDSVIVVATKFLSRGIAVPRISGEDWR